VVSSSREKHELFLKLRMLLLHLLMVAAKVGV
jgi:hypothetical protein